MSSPKKRSPFEIVRRLIVLVKPMLPIMLAAIAMGVAGHFCATFITIFGGFGLLTAAGLESPVASVGTVFVCILVFALLRGVLRYAEQASNHFIAFKLLALIRDKVFGALRRLTPAKLEGRDRGDLISLITADIEQLEVFYAHTISPVCIAVICVIGMTCFTASYHILPALVLLAGYLLVGVAMPIWSAKRGDKAAREYRQTLADTNSYVLESLRGLRDTLQYQNTNVRAEGITAHSEALGEKQKAMKYREGVTVGATNTLILLTVLAVLGVSVSLYRSGAMTEGGVLICTLLGFLQRFKCPDLTAGIIPGLADTVPWFVGCWKNIATLPRNGLFEGIPCIRTCIVYIRIRANLSSYIIVANNMICRDVIFFHQVSGQLNSRLYCCSFKIPVLICCPKTRRVLLSHAHLNPNAISVSAFRMFVTARPTMPGDIPIFHALPNFAGETDKIVCRCPTVATTIVCTIFLCSAQCSDVVDHDVFDSGDIAGIIIVI